VPDEPESSATEPDADTDADTGYTSSGVPTFDSVREKIESRYETSIGAAELDAETPAGRDVDEQFEARQRAAADRLAQIRESMRDEPR
jgi:phage shock protein A